MLKRALTGSILILLIGLNVFWLRMYSLIPTDLLILLFAAVGGWEMYSSMKKGKFAKANISIESGEMNITSANLNPILPAIISAVLIMYPLTYFLGVAGLVATLAISTIIALCIFTFKRQKYQVADLGATVLNIVYPIIIMGLFIVMNHSKMGILSIFSIFTVVVFTDTMAYLVGVTCKGPKLCPQVSPKKTISGAVGGIIGGVIGMVVAYFVISYSGLFINIFPNEVLEVSTNIGISLGILIPLGMVCSVVAELGDLGASMLKRKMGIKDFGNIFPGHGGVMDRIDSFLFVVPVMYVAFQIIMLATGAMTL